MPRGDLHPSGDVRLQAHECGGLTPLLSRREATSCIPKGQKRCQASALQNPASAGSMVLVYLALFRLILVPFYANPPGSIFTEKLPKPMCRSERFFYCPAKTSGTHVSCSWKLTPASNRAQELISRPLSGR
jgi:hypothetical protein